MLRSKKTPFVSSLIVLGIACHIIEAYWNYKVGEYTYNESASLIKAIDNFINYESGSMLFAQAFIIGGFTVIFVSYALSKKPNE